MIVLALDTTGSNCSVAVYDSDSGCILGSFLQTLGRGHAERLISAIDSALKDAQLDINRVERVITTLGPGSFTGVRVSVSVARGLSLALGAPALGVGNLEVLARSYLDIHFNRPVMVLVNLLFEKICCQIFSVNAVPFSDPILLSHDQARCEVEKFEGAVIGSGVYAMKGMKAKMDCLPMDVVARLGIEKTQSSPSPIYL
ncbi:MAG: tRNA (adenosine(37)-N6)-threonylcarbamoyltransferase complex dimerization subunit type 1 TsaB [Candidatus Liberibacter ctenarytainae]|uniref:tRNA (Adenosine(37)-N6)-threonylcarbamoyltransferase complex dimerization subunit type 1 TsaB n=1 Tax=Candidatus Liberibacter ctenarytainae TaxID=2020335 RepID=A0A937ARP8_9HYPH|nr:tRNA (adenosine(37)-N6)-threonylcarbamoyltransferase complex dimerization subunit type 1 TsaB [Candidatus Liberibacter ctenarytainae]